MRNRSRLTAAVVTSTVAACWTLLGCSAPRMQVPSDLATGSVVLNANDRSGASGALVDESFTLGSYQVTDVDRDWTVSESHSLFSVSTETKSKGGYSYNVNDMAGSCITSKVENETEGILGTTLTSTWRGFACSCSSGGSVRVDADGADFSGEMTSHEQSFSVESIDTTAEGSSTYGTPLGYRVEGAEGSLAAVEVSVPGGAWFKQGTPAEIQDDVTCLFVGMMLYKAR